MGAYQYTVSTDAFSIDGTFFPAAELSFTVPQGSWSADLTSSSFDGFALGKITNHYNLYFTIDSADAVNFFPAGTNQNTSLAHPEFASLQTAFVWNPPTVSGQTVVVNAPNFVVITRTAWDSYQWQYVSGTITETGVNLPEPPSLALWIPAVLLLAAFAGTRWFSLLRRARQSGEQR